jgi:ketosteroid isomerase-like protein
MTADDARELLRRLQAAIDARDRDALTALFHEDAVLIGTSADARDRDAVVAYLTAVTEGDPFRWEYTDVVPFHDDGFAAFGEVVVETSDGEMRAPFRLTIVVVDGLLRSFHGSIPYGSA